MMDGNWLPPPYSSFPIMSNIFLFSATDEKAKKTRAMSCMIDRFVQQHMEKI